MPVRPKRTWLVRHWVHDSVSSQRIICRRADIVQHDVVLNYLQTHAYASTARTLVEGRPGTLGDQSGGGSALYTNGAVGASYENGSTGGTISHDDGMEVDDGGTMQVKRGNAEGKGKEKAKEGVRLDEEDLVAIERRQGASSLPACRSGSAGTSSSSRTRSSRIRRMLISNSHPKPHPERSHYARRRCPQHLLSLRPRRLSFRPFHLDQRIPRQVRIQRTLALVLTYNS